VSGNLCIKDHYNYLQCINIIFIDWALGKAACLKICSSSVKDATTGCYQIKSNQIKSGLFQATQPIKTIRAAYIILSV